MTPRSKTSNWTLGPAHPTTNHHHHHAQRPTSWRGRTRAGQTTCDGDPGFDSRRDWPVRPRQSRHYELHQRCRPAAAWRLTRRRRSTPRLDQWAEWRSPPPPPSAAHAPPRVVQLPSGPSRRTRLDTQCPEMQVNRVRPAEARPRARPNPVRQCRHWRAAPVLPVRQSRSVGRLCRGISNFTVET